MDKLLYRPKEAAAVLGISKTVLYGLIRANRIRSIKDGKFVSSPPMPCASTYEHSNATTRKRVR